MAIVERRLLGLKETERLVGVLTRRHHRCLCFEDGECVFEF
jgi:hypothetical protein